MPAFSGLLAPRWRPDARGSILGISSATTKAHIVRAMLEAICWQVGGFSCSWGVILVPAKYAWPHASGQRDGSIWQHGLSPEFLGALMVHLRS